MGIAFRRLTHLLKYREKIKGKGYLHFFAWMTNLSSVLNRRCRFSCHSSSSFIRSLMISFDASEGLWTNGGASFKFSFDRIWNLTISIRSSFIFSSIENSAFTISSSIVVKLLFSCTFTGVSIIVACTIPIDAKNRIV